MLQQAFKSKLKIQENLQENLSESEDEKIINISGASQLCINESIKKPIPTKPPGRMTFGTP
jgi:hypothetical protein